ncbi:hypothetical protein [Streptomyces sp. NPDC101393]|uniref:hypothetical protein n=1 Tax=Streptomyces sp. NPDC101393 TaxID=3366141 RepID=UPI003826F3A2
MRVRTTVTAAALAAVALLTAAGSAAADDYYGRSGTITQTADSHPGGGDDVNEGSWGSAVDFGGMG